MQFSLYNKGRASSKKLFFLFSSSRDECKRKQLINFNQTRTHERNQTYRSWEILKTNEIELFRKKRADAV
jgi:hypothetical protein